MRVRRCAFLWVEAREIARFELDDLLRGGSGIVSRMQWVAHAPHVPEPIEIDSGDLHLLGGMSPTDWVQAKTLRDQHGVGRVRAMLAAGLIVANTATWKTQRLLDDRVREQHWFGLSAVAHARSRWEGLDAAREVAEAGMDKATGLREKYGPPPPMTIERGPESERRKLSQATSTELDMLFDRRATCRNFDTSAMLPEAVFSQVMQRVFGARGHVKGTDDFVMLKRTSPSGGAMHPTEAYVIAHRLEGFAPGLYHYHVGDHALQPLPYGGTPEELREFSRMAVGGQQWFADAPVLVVLAPRFARNFWKYQNHPKAYRVAILDVGHLSQTLLLTATEAGLGAYITAAINEVDIERAFGLTGFVDGPLAVCGFGARAEEMQTPEFDPGKKVWSRKRRV